MSTDHTTARAHSDNDSTFNPWPPSAHPEPDNALNFTEHPMPARGLSAVPAAFQRPGPTPEPIPFPERPANARTSQPSGSTRARWAQMERMAKAADDARKVGHAWGVRDGYRQGWRWGMLQGVAIGMLLTSIGWAAWLTATAPEAVLAGALPTSITTNVKDK